METFGDGPQCNYINISRRTSDTTGFETFESNMSMLGLPQLLQSEYSFTPLSIDLESLGSSEPLRAGGNAEQPDSARLSSWMKSVSPSTSSYDVLSEHDYERREAVPEDDNSPSTQQTTHKEDDVRQNVGNSEPRQTSVSSSPPNPVMRTVSRESTAPLRHPTPDLQSLQGAYGENVARLEKSAERLSMTSDLTGELRWNVVEPNRARSRQSSLLGPQAVDARVSSTIPRKFSSGSASKLKGSVNGAAKSGHFSSGSYLPSLRGSIGSGSWSYTSNRVRSASRASRLTLLSEPGQDDISLSSSAPDLLHPPAAVNRAPAQGSTVGRSDDGLPPNGTWPEQSAQLAPHEHLEDAGLDTKQEVPDRPATAASTDTHRQAASLFVDFDGVHFTDQSEDPASSDFLPNEGMRLASRRSQIAGRPQSYAEPLPGRNMVYYPAPVPMMLNLPQKLSKLPSTAQREKRRSQVLSSVLMGANHSTTRLPGVVEDNRNDMTGKGDPWRKSVELGGQVNSLPPQLRASVFFEQPSTHQEVEVKGDSAVATLDSILDASAHAPVSAFVDHPIVGQVGTEVYGMEKPSQRTGDMIHNKSEARRSRRWSISWGSIMDSTASKEPVKSSVDIGDVKASPGNMRVTGQHEDETEDAASTFISEATPFKQSFAPRHAAEDEHSREDDEDFHDAGETLDVEGDERVQDDTQPSVAQPAYLERPTTLLAELQLRKQQQKSRNRTAATTFPNGMHSTLLELDTVAQVEKHTRKQKHITLAWEDPEAQYIGPENHNDEDVPLGMLFPGRKAPPSGPMGRSEEDRPLGLMEKREMEDNEPLSRRRARLKGDVSASRSRSPAKRNSGMYALDVPGLTDIKAEELGQDEGETLGQRMRRLKAQGLTATGLQSRPISGHFTDEVMSQLGGVMNTEGDGGNNKAVETEEETLGQRRKRLQLGQDARLRENERSTQIDASSRPPLKSRPSMANLLQNHPAAGARQASSERLPLATLQGLPVGSGAMKGSVYQNQPIPVHHPTEMTRLGTPPGLHPPLPGASPGRPKLGDLRSYSYGNRLDGGGNNVVGAIGIPAFYSYSGDPTRSATGLHGYEGLLAAKNAMRYDPSTMAVGGFRHSMPYNSGAPHWGPSPAEMGPIPIALHPNQRDMIDRWRQSVMY